MQVTVCHSLSEIAESEWNALGKPDHPFTRYAFLHGLELHNCLEPFGWQPVYFLIYEGETLYAALPCYIKSNSYGELVFDHAWAQAYQRHGLAYYPKLVTAIPYTPATGERFLLHSGKINTVDQQKQYRELLTSAAMQFCADHQLSSWHILFEHEPTLRQLESKSFLLRCDIQFHWKNHHYQNFDDFLSSLSSRKRKNIRKERKSAAEYNLDIQMLTADQLGEHDWHRVSELYQGIYDRKYGTATLNAGFFQHLGKTLGQQTLVALARDQGNIVAASVFFRSNSHLYGRVWGCDGFYQHLHFECCYYRGIDHCIEHGLEWFDPGAQGEHKLSRGFLPTKTWSGHWLARPEFNQAIAHFLDQEQRYIDQYQSSLMDHSPYRKE